MEAVRAGCLAARGLLAGPDPARRRLRPGYAALDLAETVGSGGRVLALDRSRRFLDVLEGASRARGLGDVIQTFELDLDEGDLPDAAADGAWIR